MYAQLSPASGGALSTRRGVLNSPPKFSHPIPPLFSSRRPTKTFNPTSPSLWHYSLFKPLSVNADAGSSGTGATQSKPTAPFNSTEPLSVVGEENVPLEGVIQFEKPNSTSRIQKWGKVALLAGGDVLAILIFSAIGRFSHGFSVFDAETLATADPFIAGWFLSAYFLGGFGEDGCGLNGQTNAVSAAVKSWALGIPLLVRGEDVKKRWRNYFDKLFNDEGDGNEWKLENAFDDTTRRFVRRISVSEVKEALRKMKASKALGPDGIPIEVWRILGDVA